MEVRDHNQEQGVSTLNREIRSKVQVRLQSKANSQQYNNSNRIEETKAIMK